MMQLEVSVYLNEQALKTKTKVFCRNVYWNDSVSFPYASVIDSLKVLFGSSSIVIFQVV